MASPSCPKFHVGCWPCLASAPAPTPSAKRFSMAPARALPKAKRNHSQRGLNTETPVPPKGRMHNGEKKRCPPSCVGSHAGAAGHWTAEPYDSRPSRDLADRPPHGGTVAILHAALRCHCG